MRGEPRKVNRRSIMIRVSGFKVGVSFLLTAMSGPATAAEQQFSCKGQVVQGMPNPAVPSKPIDLNVLGDERKMSIKNGDKTLNPRITANDKIQLKFVTKE